MVPFDGKTIVVEPKQVADYYNDEWWKAHGVWASCRAYGLPFSGGWAEQPARLMDAISIMDRIYERVERERTEAEQKRAKANGRKR